MRAKIVITPGLPELEFVTKRVVAVFEAIIREREHQTDKYGLVLKHDYKTAEQAPTDITNAVFGPGGHDLTGWLLVIEKELNEAKQAATGHGKRVATGRNTVRAELLQIAAVCVAALEQHGLEDTVAATDGEAKDGLVASSATATSLRNSIIEEIAKVIEPAHGSLIGKRIRALITTDGEAKDGLVASSATVATGGSSPSDKRGES